MHLFSNQITLYHRSVVNEVSYSVELDGVPRFSWEAQPLPATEVESGIAEDFGSQLEIWTNATSILQQLYLNGTMHVETENTTLAIRKAWATANNGRY